MRSILIDSMGLLCSRNRHYNGSDADDNAQVILSLSLSLSLLCMNEYVS